MSVPFSGLMRTNLDGAWMLVIPRTMPSRCTIRGGGGASSTAWSISGAGAFVIAGVSVGGGTAGASVGGGATVGAGATVVGGGGGAGGGGGGGGGRGGSLG